MDDLVPLLQDLWNWRTVSGARMQQPQVSCSTGTTSQSKLKLCLVLMKGRCLHRPEFGGKYCTGERKRYRTCNTKPCQKDKPTFRDMQCSEFDTVPYNNELYQWIPVSNPRKYSKSLNKHEFQYSIYSTYCF